jgi:hypothetical protein
MTYRRYRRYRGYRRSRAIRAKGIGEQLSKLSEQSAILAEIRQARPLYRPSIMNVFFNAMVGCFAAAASVGLFCWTIRHLAPPQAGSRGVMRILTRIAIVIAFSVGPAWIASRGASFWLLSLSGAILTIEMIYRASWSYWGYFGLASVALCIYLVRAQKESHCRKADEEELRKKGYDPKDFDLS